MGSVSVNIFNDDGDELASWTTTEDGEHIVDQPQVIDVAHLERHRAWSSETFGPMIKGEARLDGILDHIRKELVEVEEDPYSNEWIDVIILSLDGLMRHGWESQEIIDALIAKHEKNEKRVWPDWRTAPPGAAIEHDRSFDDD